MDTANKHDYEPDEPTWRAAVRRAAIMSRTFDDAEVASRLTADEVAVLLGVDRATVYRWRAAYQADRRTSSLLPRKHGRPQGRRCISGDVDAIIMQQINEYYLVDTRPGLAELQRRIHASCHAAGLSKPAWRTVKRRVNEVEKREAALRRDGPAVAFALTPAIGSYEAALPLAIQPSPATCSDRER